MNIYQDVTDRILEQLKAGVVPWRKTWSTGLPKSLTTGKEYRGLNILLLGMTGYTSRYWVTYREAQRLGGQVRKGERSTRICFWHWRTPEDLVELRRKLGKADVAPCTCFTSAVFNVEQVDGIRRPDDDFPNPDANPLERAESLLAVMPDKPGITHTLTGSPCYRWQLDEIALPHLSQFESAAEYYTTLFHEVVHATGHPRRLNRKAQADGTDDERYSFEELVAEFGASFLSAFTGVSDPDSDALSASYIDGWAQVFQKDSRILVRAASTAQRAADYIRGKNVLETRPSADEMLPLPSVPSVAA